MALKIKVTTAGRAALVNAANTGTLPVLVSQVGVTAIAFTPAADGSDLVLPGEIKRLVTFGGAAVADDTIHSVIRDETADIYPMRGFSYYLADGTLFALYGQADPILEKSAGAMMMLATDIIFADIDAASLVFGNTDFLNPPATTDVAGVVELATDAEAITGTDPVRAVTPKGLLAVLTARFGAGNPSAFVKSLLDKVSALAFVTALGIRGAASYDTGATNGLDADLLDGEHGAFYRVYGNLTDVPLTFAPSAHTHSADDINAGILSVVRGGTGVASITAGSYLVGNGLGAVVVKTPAQVLSNIGAAAVAHSHPTSDIIGLDGALAARPLQTSVTSQISAAVNGLINGSPGALDTLNELATAMGNDANFAATVTNALAGKAAIAGQAFTGAVSAPLLTSTGETRSGGNAYATGRIYVAAGGYAGFPAAASAGLEMNAAKVSQLFAYDYSISAYLPMQYNAASHTFSSNVSVTGQLSVTGATSSINFPDRTNATQVWQWYASGGFARLYNQTAGTDVVSIVAASGNMSVLGSISTGSSLSCLTLNATGSDINLKDAVETFNPRPLHRMLADLPDTHGAVVSYTHRVDNAYRVGVIAQDMERVEPAYMGEITIAEGQVEGIAAGTYKTVDKSSAAYEQAMWAGQEIDRLLARIEALESR